MCGPERSEWDFGILHEFRIGKRMLRAYRLLGLQLGLFHRPILFGIGRSHTSLVYRAWNAYVELEGGFSVEPSFNHANGVGDAIESNSWVVDYGFGKPDGEWNWASWSTNIVNVTTGPNGTYSYVATAPATLGPYNVDAFFLGEYSGSPQYLPSKATAMINVT
jgi:hypothetical protein